jgi:hypothetical protein
VAADVQVTPAFALATALGVAALPVGLGASVQVREGWQEPAILHVAVIASPSERKTPLLTALMKPLYKAEGELTGNRDAEIAEAKAEKGRLSRQLRRAERDDDEAKAVELSNKLESLVVPPRFQAFVGKATAEALEHLAAEQGNNLARIAVVTDEGAGALGDMSRYQASPNLDPLVSGYDAVRYSSARVIRDSVRVDELRVPVLLMVQPSVWEGLRDDAAAAGRGVLARFSPVRPESLVGTRFGRGTPIPDRIAERWAARLSALLKAAYEPGPHVMTLSPDALDVFFAACDANEHELGTVREDETWCAWKGKLTGRMLRIAGVLHALNTGSLSGEISADEMRTAVALGRWLEWHAERELSGALSPDARRLLTWAEKRAEAAEPFSPGEASRHLHGWRAHRVTKAAGELVELGQLRRVGNRYALATPGAGERVATVDGSRRVRDAAPRAIRAGQTPDIVGARDVRDVRDASGLIPVPAARPPEPPQAPDPEPEEAPDPDPKNWWSEEYPDEEAPPDDAADAEDLGYDVITAPLGEPEPEEVF